MQVTQIGPVEPGAPPVHYEIGDQNGVIQLPAGIVATPDASLVGLIITLDATGWLFSAPAGTPASTGNVTFVDTSSATNGATVTQAFPCSIAATVVTGLTLFQQ